MTFSTLVTKILPSPILPVRAALMIASTARSSSSSGDHDLDLDLGQEVDHVLRAPVQLGVPLLAPEPLHLGHGQTGDADLRQRLAHLVELERFDDGFDLLHRRFPAGGCLKAGGCPVPGYSIVACPDPLKQALVETSPCRTKPGRSNARGSRRFASLSKHAHRPHPRLAGRARASGLEPARRRFAVPATRLPARPARDRLRLPGHRLVAPVRHPVGGRRADRLPCRSI